MVSALASVNEVNQRRARLVLRWVTVSGFNSRVHDIYLGMWPATQVNSAWPSLCGGCNEYQPKGGDALWLGSKGRYMVRVWVAGKTV